MDIKLTKNPILSFEIIPRLELLSLQIELYIAAVFKAGSTCAQRIGACRADSGVGQRFFFSPEFA